MYAIDSNKHIVKTTETKFLITSMTLRWGKGNF